MKPEPHSRVPRDSIGNAAVFRVLASAEDMLIAVLVFAIFCVVLAGILSRFVFHVSLSWNIEVSVTLMIWMTFIGIAVGVRDRVHVAFELFEDRLSGRWFALASFVQMLLMGFLLVALAWGGWQFMQLGLDQITPSGIPQWISFAAIPAGSALGLLHLVVHAWDVAADAGLDARAPQGHGHTGTRTQ
ncbi:TRAP transporter small permease [Caballeronia ptereochthonis]|uniref:TRAP transporter small permease protein n=1 Tax=Caballeronia ptereochthonis TaxID=1777144 RepID=A0A158AZ44_9BURK|nr:TRAP transporter small permease [Caballeronia ptereochthonis]SAK63003.1 tripartite ATP-independent periplasmic transporter DctQ [Caballeronia ptereochthonis]